MLSCPTVQFAVCYAAFFGRIKWWWWWWWWWCFKIWHFQ